MDSIIKLSSFVLASMAVIILFPSLQSFPPAEAIRSSRLIISHDPIRQSLYRKSLEFNNSAQCAHKKTSLHCNPSLIHIAMTLDSDYLRGSIAAVHSILQHSLCPQNVYLHFIIDSDNINLYQPLIKFIFPSLSFRVYYFDPVIVKNKISSSVRQALEQPLNYARNYLADLLEPCVERVIYLDSDVIVVDDVSKL